MREVGAVSTAERELVPLAPWRRLAGMRRRRLQRMGVPLCVGDPPRLWLERQIMDMAWAPAASAIRRPDRRRQIMEHIAASQDGRARDTALVLAEQLDGVAACAECDHQVLCLLLRGGVGR